MPALILFSFRQISLPHAKSLILAVCLVIAWYVPRLGERVLGGAERFAAQLAARKNLALVAIAVAVIVARVSLLWLVPIPVPVAQDEFGYLLSADTFAHGRLTNPPHPLWIFFDTFQVNQQPTYMSRYPPAQGAVMALGQILGHPWIGVLLSMSVMCAAILWMLQGWLPSVWALLGATLVFLRIGIFGYWMNSYWGGAVAAIGGALVVGALPRILDRQHPRDALLLGVGAGILANSRPVEGFFFCLPVAVVLGIWLFGRQSPSWQVTLPRIVLPICIVLAVTGAFIAYYNWRVTGNALLPPFVLNQRAYFRGQPVFIWGKKLPPVHTLNPQFDAYYNIFPGGFDGTWHGLMFVTWKKFVKFRDFFLFTESALMVPLVVLPWLLRDREVKFLVIQLVFCFAWLCTVVAFLEHYAAPLAATFFALLIQSIRYLRRWEQRGRPVGIGLARVVVLFTIAVVPLQIAQAIWNPSSVPREPAWSRARAHIEAQLAAMPGEHLVIVRYSPDHGFDPEFVFNRADIDHDKVIWAREIPGVDVRPLLDYFRGRQIWLFEPDASLSQLSAYPEAP